VRQLFGGKAFVDLMKIVLGNNRFCGTMLSSANALKNACSAAWPEGVSTK